jgi:hypothetical protein
MSHEDCRRWSSRPGRVELSPVYHRIQNPTHQIMPLASCLFILNLGHFRWYQVPDCMRIFDILDLDRKSTLVYVDLMSRGINSRRYQIHFFAACFRPGSFAVLRISGPLSNTKINWGSSGPGISSSDNVCRHIPSYNMASFRHLVRPQSSNGKDDTREVAESLNGLEFVDTEVLTYDDPF